MVSGSSSIHTGILLNRLFVLCNLGQGDWRETGGVVSEPTPASEEVGMLLSIIHTVVIFTWCDNTQCTDMPACLGKQNVIEIIW